MSIEVALDELVAEVTRRGPGYLLTTVADGRPHVMHVSFDTEGVSLSCDVGRSARRNIEAQPAVTLLWPAAEPGGYSLIVDGSATVASAEGTAGGRVTVDPSHAVLHRPA
ncbi:MAG: pyridoxamine 5'-phosphate oxidase family protein [Actinomycetota bacterium]